jgi:transcriptional regulator with XRE-family HTH domain
MLAGERLRTLRDKLGFTLKDVELASLHLVQAHGNPRYWIPQSRLSHIESKGVLPSIYRLHALAVIYRRSIEELLDWYGINAPSPELLQVPPRTHLANEPGIGDCEVPVRLDPLFDEKKTCYLRRMIQEWGVHPWTALQKLQKGEFTYGYVGSEDYTLYPMILPGTFVQIDQRLTEIETGPWASDFERPIYFLETHDSYLCAWCAVLSSREIQVQPHTLSGLAARNFRLPNEIEVVGQVVGIATKLRRVNQSAEREFAVLRTQT